MTIRTAGSWFTMDGKLGVDLNVPETRTTVTTTVTGIPELPGSSHNLGDLVQGNDGSHWMYVQASATVTTNALIAISPTNKAETLTTTHLSSAIYTIGIAQFSATAAATAQYFWALLQARNGAAVTGGNTCAVQTQLYLSSSSVGTITTTATGYALKGLYAVNALTATTTTLEVAMYTDIVASA